MTAEEIAEKLKKVIDEPYTAQVYFVLRKGEDLVIKLADIEDKTEPEIRAMFANELSETIVHNSDLKVCFLSLADEHPNAIYQYDYESYPEELGLFNDFNIKDAVKSEKFNFKADDLSELYGYIIYLGSMDDGIVLFKKHYPISLIKRSSFLLGWKKDDERFTKISGSDIIRLNGTAHLMRIDGEIYVLDVKMLERNMGFTELIGKAAEESIQAISDLGIVEDMQVLKDTLDDISFVRKLSKIKKSSPIFTLNIDAATIIKFTKETSALKGKFKYSENGNQIRLDTKKSKKEFLLLMNDAFLISELTNQYYEASSKDNISL